MLIKFQIAGHAEQLAIVDTDHIFGEKRDPLAAAADGSVVHIYPFGA